jgi:putative PEP-CTERM system TPR-repeat lipoprotein
VDALLLVANGLAETGELNEAINAAQQALKARPRNVQALRALGDLQMRKKDFAAAATTFSTLVSTQPASVEAALLLASAYMAAGETRIAISAARGALKRNPRSIEAITLLGDILLQAKRYSEATEFAQKLQRDNPKSGYGYWLEGRTLLAQGEARKAVKPFEIAAKLTPNGMTLTSLHRATAAANPGSEREDALVEWVRKNPEDRETRNYLADALSAKGRYKEAIGQYEELLRQDPKNPRALNNLAWAFLAIKDPRATEYAERAFQLSPNMAPVLDTYGWVLVNQGKVYEGIQLLLKAVALDEKNPEIRFHLAKALAQTGDKARARAELKTVLSGDQKFSHADEARALAASLGP